MLISTIVPTLDEELELPATLETVSRQAGPWELIVTDGGSRDRTLEVLPPEATLVRAAAGRALQLNAGAAVASGEVLLFLHADCRLPPHAFERIRETLRDPAVVGGGFHKRFRSDARLLAGTRLRTATWYRLGAMFGDQALFVRAEAFAASGGYRMESEAECWDLVRRLRPHGRMALLSDEVELSARRFEAHGVLRTWAGWWLTIARELRRRAAAR